MFYLVVAMIVILLLTGTILLFYSRRFILYIAKVMSLTPVTLSPAARTSIWKLKVLGIFHIVIALFISIAVAVPRALHYIPSYILFIPILIYFILSLVALVFYFKGKKLISKDPNIQR